MPTLTCARENLQQFLEGKVPECKEASWHDHLESCHQCRSRLEEMAAGNLWWKEAKTFLANGDVNGSTTGVAQAMKRSFHPHAADGESGEVPQEAISLDFLTPTDDPESLGRLGNYEVTGIVGQGGSGIVLKAFDRSLNRNVAIKVLAPHLAASGAARKRFAREAQAAAAVVHEHVVPIFAIALQQNLPYIVMQYFPGQSLQHRLDRDGPLELREILRIGLQTARGLAAAHAQGLIHRDVKPANILLADGIERISLSDFGLAPALDDARLTRTGWLAGTPEFMSPEQTRGKAMDARSDLFSLGSVLYTAATGRVPFQAETSYGTLRLVSDEEPAPVRQINPDMPEWLCALIGKLMAKLPEERYGSASEVAELLETCLAHVQQPESTPLPGALQRMRKRPRAVRAWRPQIVVAVLMGLGGFLAGWFALGQGVGPPDIAGHWTGESWESIQLKHVGAGAYEGSYLSRSNKHSGQMQLKWSQAEQQFTGTWQEGGDCFGALSLRLKKEEIRGAWTTDPSSKNDQATPRLTDIHWVKGESASSKSLQQAQGSGPPDQNPLTLVKSNSNTASRSAPAITDGLSGVWIPTLYSDGLFHIRESHPGFRPPAWDFGEAGNNCMIFFLENPFRTTFKVVESKNPVLIQVTYPNTLTQYFRIDIQKEKLAVCAHQTIPPRFAAPTEGCEYWELKPFSGDVYNFKRTIQFAYRLNQPNSSEIWPLLKQHSFPLPPSPKTPSPKLVCTLLNGGARVKESKPLLRSSENQSWKILEHGTRSQFSWIYKGRTIFKDRPDEETYEFTGSDFPKSGNFQNWSKSVVFGGKSVVVMECPTYSLTIEPSDQAPYPPTMGGAFLQVQRMLAKIATMPSGQCATVDPESGRIVETVVHGQRATVTHWTATKRRPSAKAYDFDKRVVLELAFPKKVATFHAVNLAERNFVDFRCGFYDIENSPAVFEKTENVNGAACDLYRFFNTGNKNLDFTYGLVWVDRTKSLPLKAEWVLDNETIGNTTFDWDRSVGDLSQDMKVPEGFSVKNGELSPRSSSTSPSSTPASLPEGSKQKSDHSPAKNQ